MQPITWSTEELQASVNAKLAQLRAHRSEDRGLCLEKRLELAEDRAEFERLRQAALAKRMGLGLAQPTGMLTMKAGDISLAEKKFGDLYLGRVEDATGSGGAPRSNDSSRERTDSFAASPSQEAAGKMPDAGKKLSKTKPDMRDALDSHATDIQLTPRADKPFVPHAKRYQQAMAKGAGTEASAQPGAIEQVIGFPLVDEAPDENFTEVPGDKVRRRPASLYKEDMEERIDSDIGRRRLVEQTRRQSSRQWVVLDRATVLTCLAAHPHGMTMVELGLRLLGESASPRDTRRLSALMRREEQRKTVATGGRSKPIALTPTGFAAIAAMDVKQAIQKAAERRQKRIQSQQERQTAAPQQRSYQSFTHKRRQSVATVNSADPLAKPAPPSPWPRYPARSSAAWHF